MGFSTTDQFNHTPMIGGGPALYQEDVMNPGTDSPGMGGKGGVASDPMMNLPSPENVPQPTPMNPPSTGLPGLPVPVAPMIPLGPSLANPGGQGVQPQQQIPAAPVPGMVNRINPNIKPVSVVGNQPPRPNPFTQQNRIMPVRAPQPIRPGNAPRNPMPMARGAGRGGMIR